MKMKHVIGALVICMMAATAAQAATYVRFVDVTPGGSVNEYSAGVYNLEVIESPPNTAPTVGSTTSGGTPTDSFCVDALGTISSGTGWQIYTVEALKDAPLPAGAMGTAKAKDIEQLFAAAYGPDDDWSTKTVTGVSVNDYAAAVQGAVWEIINETGPNGYRMGLDNWDWVGNTAINTQAQTWLDLINTDNTDTTDNMPQYLNLKVLSNTSYQDFAVVKSEAVVPEPLTMASAFFAIGGLGAYIRRRTGRAAA